MAKEVKLIFGIETSQSTVINIEGTIENAAPPLTVVTRNGNGQQVNYNDGKWTATLGTGQHILVIEAETGCEWFEDEPSFELTQNAKLVIHLSSSNSTTYTQVWQSDEGVAANPKNPWPPPGTAVSLSDATWFAAELSDWYAEIDNARGDKAVLDAPPPRPAVPPVP